MNTEQSAREAAAKAFLVIDEGERLADRLWETRDADDGYGCTLLQRLLAVVDPIIAAYLAAHPAVAQQAARIAQLEEWLENDTPHEALVDAKARIAELERGLEGAIDGLMNGCLIRRWGFSEYEARARAALRGARA